MAKGKGASAARKKQRVQAVLDLMIKRRLSNSKLIEAVKQYEPDISEKTAWRAIREARQILAGIGGQASAEERGLLWERIDDLYAATQSEPQPDKNLLNQLIRTQVAIYQSNPTLKRGMMLNDSQPSTQVPALSSQLTQALSRLHIPAPDSKSGNTS